jgi:hypothetical protein
MHAAQCKFLIQFSKQLIPDARPQSRGAMRPSLANRSPRKKRAQGMPGARCTRSLACEIKKHTSIVTTVTPEITRHSPRNGFTAYFALSPAIGLVCHRRLARLLARLDAGVEASEPHDFAVRVSTVRQVRCPRPPHPAPRP